MLFIMIYLKKKSIKRMLLHVFSTYSHLKCSITLWMIFILYPFTIIGSLKCDNSKLLKFAWKNENAIDVSKPWIFCVVLMLTPLIEVDCVALAFCMDFSFIVQVRLCCWWICILAFHCMRHIEHINIDRQHLPNKKFTNLWPEWREKKNKMEMVRN